MLCVLVLVQPPAEAAQVGKVNFSKGIATAQLGDGAARIIGKGFPLFEGNVISTDDRSFAVFTLDDGTKMTLRPNSVFAIEGFSEEEGSATLKLFKGGFRALTGLIAKANPKAYLLETPVATIGIRGTKLDARLCDGDCSTESSEAKKGVAVANTPVVARAALTTGNVSATGADGRIRKLTRGGPIDEKDLIETKSRSFAVLAFIDETKLTLRQKTVFQIEEFSPEPYEEAQERVLFKSSSGARTIDSDAPSLDVNVAATSRLSNTTTSGRGTTVTPYCGIASISSPTTFACAGHNAWTERTA